MKKLLCVVCLFVLFLSLLGASNSGEPAKLKKEKAVPGESFGAGSRGTVTSTEEVLEVAPKPEVKIVPKSKKKITPPVSGDPFFKGEAVVKTKTRVYSEVLDSFDLGYTEFTDCEWNGRYIYVAQGWGSSDSSDVIVFDPETGSIVDQWTLPFMGSVIGITFVNGIIYAGDVTNGILRKVNPVSHTLIASYSLPAGGSSRGITSDGTDLYVGDFTGDSIYKIDTLGSVSNTWYIGSFSDGISGLAYASRDASIWLCDLIFNQIMKVDLSGPSAVLLDVFAAPNINTPSGVAFDGSDLWYNTHDDTKLYRIDGGYSLSRIALFQDHEPWGRRSIKEILYDNGIPFKVFDSTDIGNADLSIYTKAIVPGQQDSLMGVAIANNKAWWENWISDGGVLQISGATYWLDNWQDLVLPGDFSCVSTILTATDTVDIVSPWHPLVNEPYVIDDDLLDGWSWSAHGYLIGMSDHYTVLEDSLARPILAIKRLGDGGIIATMQTLEYAWDKGYCTILENVIKYWQYGVSTNVLFAIADDDQPWMRDALVSRDSLIGNVDYMDGTSNVAKVADLSMYDVVVTYPNYPFLDTIAMGDTLAAFVDLENRSVIVGGWSWYSAGNDLQGAIMDTSYNPFYSPMGSNHFLVSSLGWYDAGHPMMNGISTFSEQYRDYLAVSPGADTVAKYADGEYLLGYKLLPSGGVVVGHNTVPRDTLVNWDGQGVRLLANIINWSYGTSGIEDVEIGDDIAILEVSSPIMTGNEWINLSIGSPANVELRIINIAGMVVSSKSLNYTTPGVKRVEFDVSSLPSGAYFLSVKAGGGKAIKKALVIR